MKNYEFDSKIVGSKLQQARLSKKLTQEQLADIVGTSKTTIANVENGAQSKGVNLETAAKICAALDISLNEVCGITPEETETPKEKVLDALKTLLTFLPCNITSEKKTCALRSCYADNVDFCISINDAVLAYFTKEFAQARKAIDANADTPYYGEIESAILKGFDARFEDISFDEESRLFYLPDKYVHVENDGFRLTDIPKPAPYFESEPPF